MHLDTRTDQLALYVLGTRPRLRAAPDVCTRLGELWRPFSGPPAGLDRWMGCWVDGEPVADRGEGGTAALRGG